MKARFDFTLDLSEEEVENLHLEILNFCEQRNIDADAVFYQIIPDGIDPLINSDIEDDGEYTDAGGTEHFDEGWE